MEKYDDIVPFSGILGGAMAFAPPPWIHLWVSYINFKIGNLFLNTYGHSWQSHSITTNVFYLCK